MIGQIDNNADRFVTEYNRKYHEGTERDAKRNEDSFLNLLARNSRKRSKGQAYGSPTVGNSYLNAYAASGYRVIDASPKRNDAENRSNSCLLPDISKKYAHTRKPSIANETLDKSKRYGSTIDVSSKHRNMLDE